MQGQTINIILKKIFFIFKNKLHLFKTQKKKILDELT